ncbi:MAG: hypothetical protein FWE16_02585 [Firmicutes bacterium]|nr:hypothetical protein [Bacillota bacterium]
MQKRKVITVVVLVAIIFVGGLLAVILNSNARAFRPVSNVPVEHRHAVSGNGGTAVSIGNYVYFIGNFVERHTIEYRQNEHNRVTYGAIYRIRLDGTGRPTYDNQWLFDRDNRTPSSDPIFDQEFFGEEWNVRPNNVELVVPKIAGHDNAAMWIFGNHLIYTSPNNQMNQFGQLQVNRIDFFRVNLDGSDHRRIFTTQSTNLTTSDFTVVWSAGNSWLLVNDGGRLVRVGVSQNPGNVHTIAQDVTGVALPLVTSYFDGGDKGFNVVMQFVYFTVDRDEEDTTDGNIMKRFRITGNSPEIIGNQPNKIYQVVTASAGMFMFMVGDWTPGGMSYPTVYVTDRDVMEGNSLRFLTQVTDILQPGEQIFLPTETTNTAFSFVTLYNANLFVWTRNQNGADIFGNHFSANPTAITTGVLHILSVKDGFVYYTTDGTDVRVVDFFGNDIDSLGNQFGGGQAIDMVANVNLAIFQVAPHFGRSLDNTFFFYMRTFTSFEVDEEGGEVVTDSKTIPVMVDRHGNEWILRVIDEYFLAR